MEEKEKPTYEQLEYSVKYWQGRSMQAEQNLSTINMTTLRLKYLFKVLKYSAHFDMEFVNKCSSEIKELLEIQEQVEQTED